MPDRRASHCASPGKGFSDSVPMWRADLDRHQASSSTSPNLGQLFSLLHSLALPAACELEAGGELYKFKLASHLLPTVHLKRAACSDALQWSVWGKLLPSFLGQQS
jgi:hypothetical protein